MERRYLAATIAMAATFALFSHAFSSGLLNRVHDPRATLISEMRCAAQTLRARLLDRVNRSLGTGSAEEAQLRVELNLDSPAMAVIMPAVPAPPACACRSGAGGESDGSACDSLPVAAAYRHPPATRLRASAGPCDGNAVKGIRSAAEDAGEGLSNSGENDGGSGQIDLAGDAARDHPSGRGTSTGQHCSVEGQLSYLQRWQFYSCQHPLGQ